MSKTKPNDFIAVHYYHEDGSMPEAKNIYTQEKLIPKGLTKREHFTSMAIQGLLSNPIFIENQGHSGMSFGLVCSMVKSFCDRGVEFSSYAR
jgi:hypothetical protein